MVMAKTPGKTELFANLRDTHGRDLPSSVPMATLLAAHPALRGKSAAELADALGIDREHAEKVIAAYVSDAVPAHLAPSREAAEGASADARFLMAGRPAEAAWVSGQGRALRVGKRESTKMGRNRNGRVESGALSFAEAGAANYSPGFTGTLPLGFFYNMPNRTVRTWPENSQGGPTVVRVDAPTAYDALCATILRGEIPADPNDPTMPAPSHIRAFCFAMGGPVGQNAKYWNPGGIDVMTGLTLYQSGMTPVEEELGSWPYPQAGESFDPVAVREAFAAFQWYGALPGDLETPEGVKYLDGWDNSVSHERYVFWYAYSDGAWDKCQQVQGWDTGENKWVLPTRSGEYARAWYWRPTDSQFVGEWRMLFSFDNWMNENKTTLAVAAFWVMSIVVTVSTLGAGAATLAAAAAVSAVLIAAQKLFSACVNNDPAGIIKATLEFGKAINTAAGGDLVGAIKRDHPELAAFASNVAAPFQKIYEAAGGAMSDVRALWDKAIALKSGLPLMGQVGWSAAVTAVGAADSGVGTWLQMARLPSDSEIGAALWANAPPWAKDVVALGLSLNSLEKAQSYIAKSAQFNASSVPAPKLAGGGMFAMAVLHEVSDGQGGKTWEAVPPPPIVPPVPKFAASSGGSASAALPVVAAAGLGLWLMMGKGFAKKLF